MHNPSNNMLSRDDLDAHALRAWAAGGFGDAAIGVIEPHKALNSTELYHRARSQRSYRLREIVAAALNAAAASVRRAVEQWRLQRRTRATFLALRELDARVLRDLGIHRSEILSVAAELARAADLTRVRAV